MAGLSVKEVLRGMMSLYDESLAARSLEVEYGLTELTATTRGMHRSMVLEVSLFSDAHNESICDRTVDKSPLHLLLLWEFPDSVYIEPTELQRELRDSKVAGHINMFTLMSAADSESLAAANATFFLALELLSLTTTPSFNSYENTLHTCDGFDEKKDDALLSSSSRLPRHQFQLNIPLHIRYHAPHRDILYVNITMSSPLALVSRRNLTPLREIEGRREKVSHIFERNHLGDAIRHSYLHARRLCDMEYLPVATFSRHGVPPTLTWQMPVGRLNDLYAVTSVTFSVYLISSLFIAGLLILH